MQCIPGFSCEDEQSICSKSQYQTGSLPQKRFSHGCCTRNSSQTCRKRACFCNDWNKEDYRFSLTKLTEYGTRNQCQTPTEMFLFVKLCHSLQLIFMHLKPHKLFCTAMVFPFFYYSLATSMTNWAQMFTGLSLYACVWIYKVAGNTGLLQ